MKIKVNDGNHNYHIVTDSFMSAFYLLALWNESRTTESWQFGWDSALRQFYTEEGWRTETLQDYRGLSPSYLLERIGRLSAPPSYYDRWVRATPLRGVT